MEELLCAMQKEEAEEFKTKVHEKGKGPKYPFLRDHFLHQDLSIRISFLSSINTQPNVDLTKMEHLIHDGSNNQVTMNPNNTFSNVGE